MKLVMVDDSEQDRRLFRRLLEESIDAPLQFWGEKTGEKALETCREVTPDCILLDYKLPDMSGLDFIARLRFDEGRQAATEAAPAAVVVLTALVDEQVAVNAMRAGAQDYLIKDRMTREGLGASVQRATAKIGLTRQLRLERDRLTASLAEKEVLLKEVHHRVKNNLQVIVSLLRLQARAFHCSPLADALRETQHRVESMALIHEQLYATEDLREVDLAMHASMLLNNLLQSYGIDEKRIVAQIGMDPLPLGVDLAIPAGLILNELISNALKHAFPEDRRGSIRIEGKRSEGTIQLRVCDDGIGFSNEFDLRAAKSFGLQLVNILIGQLKGEIEMECRNGTDFRISFPSS